MKTSQSFFPTRTHLKSRDIRHQRTFQLIKKPQEPNDAAEDDDDFNINIFREAQQPTRKLDMTEIQRPVGGMDLFRKMEQTGKDRYNENRRHSKRSNKESTQRNISSNFNNNRFRKDKSDAEDRQNVEAGMNKPISELSSPNRSSLPQETFKSHIAYMPNSVSVKSHTRGSTFKASGKSESVFRPATSKPNSYKSTVAHDQWAADQRKEYQDKAALLNQINYNRPLVEVYGDRYFEYMLRNRFEEDLKPPSYVYQIGKKFSESRVIDKIKKYRPEIREKGMMVVRGKRLGCDEA